MSSPGNRAIEQMVAALTYNDVEWSGKCPVPPAPARPLRLLCDADGVLVDFVRLCQNIARWQHWTALPREAFEVDWDHFAGAGLPPDCWDTLREQVEEDQACRGMWELPGARAFWQALQGAGYHVRVCTSPLPNCPAWIGQRAAWLQENWGVPAHQQIHIHDKHSLAGAYDVLIDDKAENCAAFEDAGGRAWCIAAPYNDHYEGDRGTYEECLEWLARLQAARRGEVRP